MTTYTYDYTTRDIALQDKPVLQQVVGASNQEEVERNRYNIENLVPGRSYKLDTFVYNRGQTLIHQNSYNYWPTSNLAGTTLSTQDFVDNITFQVDNSANVVGDFSGINHIGYIKFILYYENIDNEIYIQTPFLGPYPTSELTFSDQTIYLKYGDLNDGVVFDVYYSVIIDDYYVISHRPISISDDIPIIRLHTYHDVSEFTFVRMNGVYPNGGELSDADPIEKGYPLDGFVPQTPLSISEVFERANLIAGCVYIVDSRFRIYFYNSLVTQLSPDNQNSVIYEKQYNSIKIDIHINKTAFPLRSFEIVFSIFTDRVRLVEDEHIQFVLDDTGIYEITKDVNSNSQQITVRYSTDESNIGIGVTSILVLSVFIQRKDPHYVLTTSDYNIQFVDYTTTDPFHRFNIDQSIQSNTMPIIPPIYSLSDMSYQMVENQIRIRFTLLKSIHEATVQLRIAYRNAVHVTSAFGEFNAPVTNISPFVNVDLPQGFNTFMDVEFVTDVSNEYPIQFIFEPLNELVISNRNDFKVRIVAINTSIPISNESDYKSF